VRIEVHRPKRADPHRTRDQALDSRCAEERNRLGERRPGLADIDPRRPPDIVRSGADQAQDLRPAKLYPGKEVRSQRSARFSTR
jgi:hypothetical protein